MYPVVSLGMFKRTSYCRQQPPVKNKSRPPPTTPKQRNNHDNSDRVASPHAFCGGGRQAVVAHPIPQDHFLFEKVIGDRQDKTNSRGLLI
jgi:hypothetical protein